MPQYGIPCQIADCDASATELLRSRETGNEYHFCQSCASEFKTTGWKVIRGNVELIDHE